MDRGTEFWWRPQRWTGPALWQDMTNQGWGRRDQGDPGPQDQGEFTYPPKYVCGWLQLKIWVNKNGFVVHWALNVAFCDGLLGSQTGEIKVDANWFSECLLLIFSPSGLSLQSFRCKKLGGFIVQRSFSAAFIPVWEGSEREKQSFQLSVKLSDDRRRVSALLRRVSLLPALTFYFSPTFLPPIPPCRHLLAAIFFWPVLWINAQIYAAREI